MNFHVVTVHPELLSSYLGGSIIGRARTKKTIGITLYNPRDFEKSSYKSVDGKPYGGGPGMVQKALPFVRAVGKAVGRKKNVRIIVLTPNGSLFNSAYARSLSKHVRHIVLVAGHYEGIDARLVKILKDVYGAAHIDTCSVGNFVLTGGELASLIIVDAISRLIPGVLGNNFSDEEKRIASNDVYTRPEVITYKGKTYRVPRVLLLGNHGDIDTWRSKNRRKRKKRS